MLYTFLPIYILYVLSCMFSYCIVCILYSVYASYFSFFLYLCHNSTISLGLLISCNVKNMYTKHNNNNFVIFTKHIIVYIFTVAKQGKSLKMLYVLVVCFLSLQYNILMWSIHCLSMLKISCSTVDEE